MSKNLSQPLNAALEQEFYTPKPKQARIIERHFRGDSKRKIAREERVDRETVTAILSQKEVVMKMAQLQSKALGLGDMALDVLVKAMTSKDLVLAAATSNKLLEGVGIF